MMAIGKTVRLRRIVRPGSQSSIICALDHGMTSPGVLSGLVDVERRAREAQDGGANAFMISRGITRRVVASLDPDTAILLMLTASAAGRPAGAVVTPIGSVEEALTLGADGVVVYVALAGDDEREMIQYASAIGEACDRLGMPFVAEAEYPNAYQHVDELNVSLGWEYLARNARLCAELGADVVKVNWSGDQETFAEIVRMAGVPVVMAGGPVIADEELLRRAVMARDAGAVGCSVGRNIFQHPHPVEMTAALANVFHNHGTLDAALSQLGGRSARSAEPSVATESGPR